MDELTNAISKSHDTAVGPDSIHYQMFKNLPDSAMDTLLGAINFVWTTGNFPPEWHLALSYQLPNLVKIQLTQQVIGLSL